MEHFLEERGLTAYQVDPEEKLFICYASHIGLMYYSVLSQQFLQGNFSLMHLEVPIKYLSLLMVLYSFIL